MYCIINPGLALRSWRSVPYAYYQRHKSCAEGLSRAEFECLLLADSAHDLPENEVLNSLIARGFLKPCAKNEYTVSEWSSYRHYDNRYMGL